MIEAQTYHAVFRHCCVSDDLIIAGIFTLRQDAELLVIDLKVVQHKKVARLEMSLCAIKEFLMKERLGKVAQSFQRLEKILNELNAA